MRTNFSSRFFLCGIFGWCMEIIFTSLHCLKTKDRKMIGNTSIWMFPIYGMACLFAPLFERMRHKNVFHRGSIYAMVIFVCEYVSGTLLKKFRACPWDYSQARFNIKGLIRLDYAPLWFGAGLLFEKVLTEK